MKTLHFRIVFVTFALIFSLAISPSFGQFNFGIKAGINSNKFVTGADEFKSEATRFGFVGGMFFRFRAGMVSIEPQVLFSQRNGEYSYSTLHNSVDSIFKNNLNYIDIPLLFGLNLGPMIKLHTGPVFSFLVKQDLIFEVKDQSLKVGVQDNAFKQLNFGWQIGGDIEISRLVFGILYEKSIQNMTGSFNVPGINSTFTPDARNSLWQFSVGYKFLKK